jgi:hypothetical protein
MSRLKRLLTRSRSGIQSFAVRMIVTAVECLWGVDVGAGDADGMFFGGVGANKYNSAGG